MSPCRVLATKRYDGGFARHLGASVSTESLSAACPILLDPEAADVQAEAATLRAQGPATAVELQVEVQRVRPDQRVESVGPEELGWQPVQGLRTSRGAQVYHSSSLESVSYHFDDGAYVVNAYLYRSCPARSADVVAEGVCLSANEIGAILRGFSIVKWGNP